LITIVPMAVVTMPRIEPDGRNQRRANSYDAAVDAALDLIAELGTVPTAQQIAERSGISIRTVFRLTEDTDQLHAAAMHRQIERTAALYVEPPRDGPLAERIRALVGGRASIFEAIAPVRRVAETLALTSRLISDGLEFHHALLRAQAETTFEPELAQLSRAGRTDVLNAVDVASGWETWDQLRRMKGLTPRESQRVVQLLLTGVLQSAGAVHS
jgi:TetR/AcrR family transcriptional regulator, regulator of autoinduction and epiphytic fitness